MCRAQYPHILQAYPINVLLSPRTSIIPIISNHWSDRLSCFEESILTEKSLYNLNLISRRFFNETFNIAVINKVKELFSALNNINENLTRHNFCIKGKENGNYLNLNGILTSNLIKWFLSQKIKLGCSGISEEIVYEFSKDAKIIIEQVNLSLGDEFLIDALDRINTSLVTGLKTIKVYSPFQILRYNEYNKKYYYKEFFDEWCVEEPTGNFECYYKKKKIAKKQGGLLSIDLRVNLKLLHLVCRNLIFSKKEQKFSKKFIAVRVEGKYESVNDGLIFKEFVISDVDMPKTLFNGLWIGLFVLCGGVRRSSYKFKERKLNLKRVKLFNRSIATTLAEKVNAGKYSSKEIISLEHKYGAHNYHPLPVVISRGKGIHVWDPEGNKYMDFLSAYSAVNQGHSHPKIIGALIEQAQKLALSSRAFYNSEFSPYAKFITEYFGHEMVLPMNTGAEAVETAIKLSRKWGYMKKGIKPDQAIILACTENFHGRTISIISMSNDETATVNFGPFVPNVGAVCPKTGKKINHSVVKDLEAALEAHGDRVAAFLIEPIQGEAGINVPEDGYLKKCYDLCKKHNVLFIADEIQTGLCRTGKMLAIDHDGVKPDILILGKALSGGAYPVSAVLSSKDIMLCIQPGEHGSTYGGNPLGCAVAVAALKVLKEENMAENVFSFILSALIRGKGLLNAVVIDEDKVGKTAWQICLLMKHYGLLAKPTHQNIIRLAPPLCITEEQLMDGVNIIKRVLEEIPSMKDSDIPGNEEH
ncbi:ornithine aminotransferase [Clydaea vesicula]|uniref:ornithine aminotransferase n=1 Tax=Clydaea vesicula TaxID=447962 RepID=A0AAD5U777_9FUNG|nr:ornithine aminotransferase [Clydaea vesicula]